MFSYFYFHFLSIVDVLYILYFTFIFYILYFLSLYIISLKIFLHDNYAHNHINNHANLHTLMNWKNPKFKKGTVEKCPYSEYFWSIFSSIWTEYRQILSISPSSVRMLENMDQKNSKYGHFSRSESDVQNLFALDAHRHLIVFCIYYF